ncbi:hypothetical protein GCM10025867_03640 [Frondihabitans sucicola]|uniref:HTH gntR-type domain-containing protein n=1 Tax=Frondihabitans sucicola TaxID=1268041 RepID=A0ABN6XVG6_9MICO|nr:GntR family transcriptional regulator [Frondihabitans sucicola]BDZ48123.1 hypothetical protein GCM10025867_03640 [Frondihabitans sucicola]
MPIPSETAPAASRVLLRDRIRDQIREAILDGVLQPGERLLDDDLVAWLGCSRTPIREALADLEHAGFIEISPNRYTRVAAPRDDEAFEVVQTLGVLFGGAVLLATPRLPEAARDQAVTMIDVCLADIGRGEALSLNRHYQELFDLFVEHCGNAHLTRVCRETSSGLAYKLRLPDSAAVFDWPAMLQPLADLRAAVLRGDAVAAELAGETLHRLHELEVAAA